MAVTHVFTPCILQATTSSAAPPSKAYTSAVAAGDLLWAFVWVNSATTTVTSVTDSVNGAWTQAFGPIRGDATNFNATLYGFYKANSSAGTPTLTVVTSANTQGGYIFGAIRGLAGGGALDQFVGAKQNGPNGVGWQLTTSALAQAIEAGIGFVDASSSLGTPLWTADLTIDIQNGERVSRTVTSSTAAQTFGTSGSVGGGSTATLAAMLFKDAVAPATLSGDVTLDDSTPGGGLSSVASSLGGDVTLDDAAISGTLGAAPGRIRLLGVDDEWRDKAGNLLASRSATVDVHSATTGAQLARITTATDAAGLLPELSHGALAQSTLYRVDVLFGTGEYGVVYRNSEAT